MLSESFEVIEMRKHLVFASDYGYELEEQFEDALEDAIDQAKIQYMVPALGEVYYNTIAVKDGASLTATERYIYEAEIRFAVSEFLLLAHRRELQRRPGDDYNLGKKGSSRQVKGVSGKAKASALYKDEAYFMMNLAGYEYKAQLQLGGVDTSWRRRDVAEM